MLPSGTEVPVVAVSTTRDGTLDVPADVDVAGWWRGGSRIGDPFGSVLLSAHVDSEREGLGPYAELLGVRPGQTVVLTSEHLRQEYVVSSLRLLDKGPLSDHPWVYSATGAHRLVMVTCAGPFDPGRGGYQQPRGRHRDGRGRAHPEERVMADVTDDGPPQRRTQELPPEFAPLAPLGLASGPPSRAPGEAPRLRLTAAASRRNAPDRSATAPAGPPPAAFTAGAVPTPPPDVPVEELPPGPRRPRQLLAAGGLVGLLVVLAVIAAAALLARSGERTVAAEVAPPGAAAEPQRRASSTRRSRWPRTASTSRPRSSTGTTSW